MQGDANTIAFAEKVLALTHEAQVTATYKFAILVGV
jgi:hypothetical protein